MATAAEKEALGLPADASEDDVTAKIAELTGSVESLQKERDEAVSAQSTAESNLAAEQERAQSMRQEVTEQVRGEFKDRVDQLEQLAQSLGPEAVASEAPPGVQSGGHDVRIRIRAFPYYVEIPDPVTGQPSRRELIATRGQPVTLSDADYERGLRFDAFMPEGGDVGEDVLVTGGAASTSIEELAQWLRTSQPTAEETVDAADDDPVIARKLLDAENLVTGQQPRDDVKQGLQEIIDASR